MLGWDPHEPFVEWLILQGAVAGATAGARHEVRLLDPGVRRLAAQRRRRGHGGHLGLRAPARQRAEKIGYDLTLIAELNLNDIKGVEAPALDAWSTAAALAAVTERLELMVAVRPNFHQPALFAKQAANIDRIAGGRLALNVVSSWWAEEAKSYGLQFDQHDDRYARTAEWLAVVTGSGAREVHLRGPALPLRRPSASPSR